MENCKRSHEPYRVASNADWKRVILAHILQTRHRLLVAGFDFSGDWH